MSNFQNTPLHMQARRGKPTTKAAQDANLDKSYTRVWVGGLPRNRTVDEVKEELVRLFSRYGTVSDVCVITTPKDVFAFVQYGMETDASKAQEDINGTAILGSIVKVNYAVIRGGVPGSPNKAENDKSQLRRRRVPREGSMHCVFIIGMPADITLPELYKIGSDYLGTDTNTEIGNRNIDKETSSPNNNNNNNNNNNYVPRRLSAFIWFEDSAPHVICLLVYDRRRDAVRCRLHLHGAHAKLEGEKWKKLKAYTMRRYNQKYGESTKEDKNMNSEEREHKRRRV